jgi:hypothetical protein
LNKLESKWNENMKKFVLIATGFGEFTPEFRQASMDWFNSLKDRMVEPGYALGHGHEITAEGIRELAMDENALTGYMVIEAEDLAEAQELARKAPLITGIRVYEAMSM